MTQGKKESVDVLVLRYLDGVNLLQLCDMREIIRGERVTVEKVPVKLRGDQFHIHGVLVQRGVDDKGREGLVVYPSKMWVTPFVDETLEQREKALRHPRNRSWLEKTADPVDGPAALYRLAELANSKLEEYEKGENYERDYA